VTHRELIDEAKFHVVVGTIGMIAAAFLLVSWSMAGGIVSAVFACVMGAYLQSRRARWMKILRKLQGSK
jgi:hypothetical protein